MVPQPWTSPTALTWCYYEDSDTMHTCTSQCAYGYIVSLPKGPQPRNRHERRRAAKVGQ